MTLVTAGRVGKPHGLDGSFYVDGASHPLPVGTALTIADRPHEVERRAGTDERPLIRLAGLDDPGGIAFDERFLVELEDGLLVPFISDAIESVHGGEIRLKEGFLG